MSQAPEYEIQHIDDFLNVPEDRLDACLSDFRTFLRMHRATRGMVAAIAETLELGEATTKSKFTWIDDDKGLVSVIFEEPKESVDA